MAFIHHDTLAVSHAVKTTGNKRKRKADEAKGLGDGGVETSPSKKAKGSDPKEKKKEIDRDYQQGCRQKANERREEMWRLAGVTTGTLEKRDEACAFSVSLSLASLQLTSMCFMLAVRDYVRRCFEGQCHPELVVALANSQKRIEALEEQSAFSMQKALEWRGELDEAITKLQEKHAQIHELSGIIRNLSGNGSF